MFKEQGMISLWTVLGLVGIKVKFQASPSGFNQFRVCVLKSAVFIWRESASYKNNLGMCVRP